MHFAVKKLVICGFEKLAETRAKVRFQKNLNYTLLANYNLTYTIRMHLLKCASYNSCNSNNDVSKFFKMYAKSQSLLAQKVNAKVLKELALKIG